MVCVSESAKYPSVKTISHRQHHQKVFRIKMTAKMAISQWQYEIVLYYVLIIENKFI